MDFNEKIDQLNAEGFYVGAPLSEAEPVGDGYKMRFENAILYQNSFYEIFEVHGAILGKYMELGEAEGELGFPTSDELDNSNVSGGKWNSFDNGYITWDPNSGAQETINSNGNSSSNNTSGDLISKLQSVADFAYTLLQMPLADAKNIIFKSENPSDPNNWCGNTLGYFYKNGGASKKIVNTYFAGTLGLSSYGSYYKIGFDGNSGELVRFAKPLKVPKIISDGTPLSLEEYHQQRGIERKIILFDEIQAGGSLDILPGDIVLFDGRNKSGPDHIQMVYQWDENDRTLIVIDGNGGGFALDGYGTNAADPNASGNNQSKDNTLKTDKIKILEDKLGTGVIYTDDGASGRVGITCHILTNDHQVNPPAENTLLSHARVWAVIRPSLADFEDHEYTSL